MMSPEDRELFKSMGMTGSCGNCLAPVRPESAWCDPLCEMEQLAKEAKQ